jgi:hypothetical protein
MPQPTSELLGYDPITYVYVILYVVELIKAFVLFRIENLKWKALEAMRFHHRPVLPPLSNVTDLILKDM